VIAAIASIYLDGEGRFRLFLVWVAVSICTSLGVLAAADRPLAAVVLALAPLSVLLLVRASASAFAAASATRKVVVIWSLLLASTFVWRQRTTDELVQNPLDSAARIRILLVAAVGPFVIALLATRVPRASLPLKFLGLYIVAAFLSALLSPLPLHALYRAIELGVGCLAAVVAFTLLGDRYGTVLFRVLLGSIGLILAVVWLEALLLPSKGWVKTVSVIPYELQGYMPSFASNSVGTFGAILAVAGLGYRAASSSGIWACRLGFVAGSVTVLAAQYRTGIIALLLASLIILWQRRRALTVIVALSAATLIVGIGPHWGSVEARGQEAFAKGRPETLATLDSRTIYWNATKPAIEERPLLGWGLNVGSRQALASLGLQGVSTIHGTWIEALVGTGVIGTAFLALALLSALWCAWRARSHPLGLAALGILIVLAVRSITGPTIELFDNMFLVFIAAVAAASEATQRKQDLQMRA
jgi:O-antigen ligase